MTAWTPSRRWHYRDDVIAWDVVGEGDPVVLLHGFPGSSFSWRRILPELATRYRCYVLDFAGFGCSGRRPGQQVDQRTQARLLNDALDEWGLDAPAVVAHDFGASVAMGSALLDGRPFSHIMLLAPAVLNPCLRQNSRHGREHHRAYSSMPSPLFAHLLRFILPTTMSNDMDQATYDGYAGPWLDRAGQESYYRFLAQFSDDYLDDLERLLPLLDQPVHIVWGDKDTWIPPQQAVRLQRRLPQSSVTMIANAGHFLMEDAPAEVATAIMRGLER